MPKYINISKDKVPSKAPLDVFCNCGMILNFSGKCTRKYPIKACKGGQAEKRPKYRGKSKFFEYKEKGFNEMGYAGK